MDAGRASPLLDIYPLGLLEKLIENEGTIQHSKNNN
jgi:hypothetical protein